MEREDIGDVQSTSKWMVVSNLDVMHDKVNEFLKTGKFKKGSPLSDSDITSVIEKLGKITDVFSVDLLENRYREFLNKYGSIYGEGLKICGPIEYRNKNNIDNTEKKVNYISLIQRGFENRCRINKMKEENIKSCWLIAVVDQGDQYYVDLSGTEKDNIYSMSIDGTSKVFARNFLEFLDKFFAFYKSKAEEEISD